MNTEERKLARGFESEGLTRRELVKELSQNYKDGLLEAAGGELPTDVQGQYAFRLARGYAANDLSQTWDALKESQDAAYWQAWRGYHREYALESAREWLTLATSETRYAWKLKRQAKRNESRMVRDEKTGKWRRIKPVGRPATLKHGPKLDTRKPAK